DDGSQDRNSVLHIASDEDQIGVARVPCGSPNALPGALAEWLYGRDQAADFRRGRIGDLTELTIADSKQVGDRTVLQLFLVKCHRSLESQIEIRESGSRSASIKRNPQKREGSGYH